VTLELQDVNDNAPVFIQSHFEIYIDENESTFPYRFRVEAFDRDLNGNFFLPFFFVKQFITSSSSSSSSSL